MNNLEEYITAKDWSKPPMISPYPDCLSWSLDKKLIMEFYVARHQVPNELEEDTPGAEFFDGHGHLSSTLLINALKHCVNMFAVEHK
jgi:hypothetical protein